MSDEHKDDYKEYVRVDGNLEVMAAKRPEGYWVMLLPNDTHRCLSNDTFAALYKRKDASRD